MRRSARGKFNARLRPSLQPLRRRKFRPLRHQVCGQACCRDRSQSRQKESGNDFIEPKPSEMVPNEHRGSSHHHAAERAHAGHALPPERDENHRTKGCAKASPGVRTSESTRLEGSLAIQTETTEMASTMARPTQTSSRCVAFGAKETAVEVLRQGGGSRRAAGRKAWT